MNVSVRRKGAQELGTKVEVKNLNSFSAVRSAVDFEFRRQTSLLEAGRGSEIKQETRLWDEQRMETKSMRSKEEAADYRYFREPDLPFLALRPGFADQVKAEMPKLPREARDDLLGLGLSVADASILSDDLGLFEYYTECVSSGAEPKQACNWLVGDISALLKEMKRDLDACAMRPQQLAEMCQLIDGGTISGKIAKGLLPELLEKGGSPKDLVESKGLVQVSTPEDCASHLVLTIFLPSVGPDLGRGRARQDRGGDSGVQPQASRAVPRRQGQALWLLRWADHEGHEGEGEPEDGERLPQEGARSIACVRGRRVCSIRTIKRPRLSGSGERTLRCRLFVFLL